MSDLVLAVHPAVRPAPYHLAQPPPNLPTYSNLFEDRSLKNACYIISSDHR